MRASRTYGSVRGARSNARPYRDRQGFGRFAAADRERRGSNKPETFDFLGFTFICGKSRKGGFLIKRKTRADRMRAKLKEVKEGCANACTGPSPSKADGWGRSSRDTSLFRRADQRPRAQRLPLPDPRPMATHASAAQPPGSHEMGADGQPGARIPAQAPGPSPLAQRTFRRQTPEVGAVCGKAARTDLCGGRAVTRVPTAITPPAQLIGSGGGERRPRPGL